MTFDINLYNALNHYQKKSYIQSKQSVNALHALSQIRQKKNVPILDNA